MRSKGSRAILLKLIAVVLGIGTAALCGEMGLRLADRFGWIREWEERRIAWGSSIWMKSENPALIYQHRPDYSRDGVRYTEASGILQPEDAAVEPIPGRLRVAALGDSVGAAIKLPYADRVFTRVQEDLGARLRRPVEVLNFCVNGYSTLQEAELLKEVAHRFEPDFLILQYCINDFYPTEYPAYWFLEQSPSYLVAYLRHTFETGLVRGYPPARYWEEMYRSDSPGWENVAAGFGSIAQYCKSRGIPCLLAVFPALSKGGWEEGNARERHRRVFELGKAKGFEVLDLLPIYSRYPVDQLRFDPWDTFHPNVAGHRIAAEAITSAALPLLEQRIRSTGGVDAGRAR